MRLSNIAVWGKDGAGRASDRAGWAAAQKLRNERTKTSERLRGQMGYAGGRRRPKEAGGGVRRKRLDGITQTPKAKIPISIKGKCHQGIRKKKIA